ncbi:hypothetical protein BGZ47_004373, partial [Haplosporangium gracile]
SNATCRTSARTLPRPETMHPNLSSETRRLMMDISRSWRGGSILLTRNSLLCATSSSPLAASPVSSCTRRVPSADALNALPSLSSKPTTPMSLSSNTSI